MKTAELLRVSVNILETLHKSGIKQGDYQYLGLYSEYEKMKLEGEKTTYIVAVLSDKYDICERKIYKIIHRLNKDCQNGAAV